MNLIYIINVKRGKFVSWYFKDAKLFWNSPNISNSSLALGVSNFMKLSMFICLFGNEIQHKIAWCLLIYFSCHLGGGAPEAILTILESSVSCCSSDRTIPDAVIGVSVWMYPVAHLAPLMYFEHLFTSPGFSFRKFLDVFESSIIRC